MEKSLESVGHVVIVSVAFVLLHVLALAERLERHSGTLYGPGIARLRERLERLRRRLQTN